MAFHRDDIERVRHATNIVELLEGVTTVRKRGRTFTAICPFHQEKTPSLSIDVGQGLYHCLAGDTGVLTWEGVVPIEELAGDTHRLLTTGGVWVDAPILSFGEQRLWEIRLSRNGVSKSISATSGHRWLVRNGRRVVEVTTEHLEPGLLLAYAYADNGRAHSRDPATRTGPERKGWVVREVRKTDRIEEVFCAEVDGTHAFTLEDNILTGNCFGCQAGGDVFKFVQETQGLDFSEAVEQLAGRAGIALQRDPEAIRRKGEREGLIEATRAAVDFYRERLKSGHDAGGARSYLRGRGYDVDVIDRFQLGFAPGGDVWDALVAHLRDAGVSEKVMIGAGLAARTSRGRLRDWFRGRTMFPIFDLRGDPVGFGARILEGEGPKYLNSPETRIYQKARLLYGLNWAKSDITRAGYSLVVEGYTDVIGLHLAGLPQAVATCGTALGEEHFDLLRRFAERVVLAFDADQAGAGAAIRGDELEIPVKLDLDLRVAVMPEGKDPADLVRAGDTAVMRSAVEDSIPLLQFRLARELERFDLAEPEGRARAVREAARLIARQRDDLVRREYARFVARRVGTDFDAVMAEIRGGSSTRRSEAPPPEQEPRRRSGVERAERELLRALLANDARLADTEVDAALFMDGLFRDAYLLIAPALAGFPPGEPPDLAALIGEGDAGGPALLRALALDALPISNPVALVDRLRAWRIERDIAELRRLLDRIDPTQEPETYSAMFEQLIALERKKRDLGDR
jgi:DNA primase